MKIYQVDAFHKELFKGNPAAVCPLDAWISEDLMQNIASENNLSETVFFVPSGIQFEIRWFTPESEIDLCGHATLAAAHIIFTELQFPTKKIEFTSKSGLLTVVKKDDWYTLNFPSETVEKIDNEPLFEEVLGASILSSHKGKWKYMFEIKDENTLLNLKPNFNLMRTLGSNGIIVTAPGDTVDFVSRFFAPKLGIDEDPVTGSAHTLLIPYWSKKLNKTKLKALQLSKRTGILDCNYLQERVEMSGQAITFLKGTILFNT